ncbi:MAG TPA: OmpA family protein [Oligoflexia bacterium]|nr:OmpA family protein [Oligoflexia bacterium]
MATISKQQNNINALGACEVSLLSQEGQRRIRPFFIAASVGFALLYFFSLQYNKFYIEQDLKSRSQASLSNEDIEVTFFGRDAVVTGTVTSAIEATQTINKIAQVWGVRKVNSQLYTLQTDAQEFKQGSLARQLLETGQVTLSDLEFSSDNESLKAPAKRKLDDLLRALVVLPGAVFKISAHTDSIGEAAHNFKLSLKRAEAIKAYFIQHNVEEQQLVTHAYGENQPIADNRTAEGRRRNRRIDITQLKPSMLK